MEIQRSLSDCFLRIEAEVIHHNKSQLSVGEPPRLSGAPAESLDFIKVWISEHMRVDLFWKIRVGRPDDPDIFIDDTRNVTR